MLRLERIDDYYEVENLIRDAFWNVYQPGCDEHYVMHLLRDQSYFVKELDYLIEENHEIIAHIAYSKGTLLKENQNKKEILLFGPISVKPKYQRMGYGKQIIEATLDKAKQLGYPCVAITGNPNYYHRFGFESASKYQIFYHGMDKNDEAPFFMIKVLNKDKMNDLQGVYFDPACYFVASDDVNRFDEHFPYKEKCVLPGQLR